MRVRTVYGARIDDEVHGPLEDSSRSSAVDPSLRDRRPRLAQVPQQRGRFAIRLVVSPLNARPTCD
jgi:hypothetical protein